MVRARCQHAGHLIYRINSSDFAIRQAYVALRAPVGTGLDLKMGVFDSIIGYESVEAGNDPNSLGRTAHSIEPQTQTGLLASYRFCDAFSASAGVADTVNSAINSRAQNGIVGGCQRAVCGLLE